jgi:AraC family transcriptional regulator
MAEGPVFRVEETHGRVLRAGNEIIAQSTDSGWQSLYAAKFREAPLSVTEPAIGHPSLIYHLVRPTRVTRKLDGIRAERTLIGPGRFCVTPGDAAAHWQHSGNPEILQLYVRQSVFERAAEEMFGGTAALVPRFAIVDPLLEQLAIAVLDALRDGRADDRLYVETVAQLMAVHLARAHSSRGSVGQRHESPDGLSSARVRRLLDYIEQHLGEDLSLESLAAEVNLSPLYLVRAFRSAVGQSPHQYVVARRVEHARRLLAGTALPIAEISLASGFSSQSHLSSWFRRLVGVSPAAYRKHH